MKSKLIFCALWTCSLFAFACQKNTDQKVISSPQLRFSPAVDPDSLTANFMHWWTYQSYEISLSSDFMGYDNGGELLDKKSFLNQLTSGDYIPLRAQPANGVNQYQLFKMDSVVDRSIRSTIKSQAFTSLKHFEMEGSPFPLFDFKDLNGNHYSNENTRGKILVFKTWFIKCQACIAEFPELNELVHKYQAEEDILFISLATNAQNDLADFLQKRPFKYAVIPKQGDLIADQLELQIYPTHIIVDKTGKIRKVVNKAAEMIHYLATMKDLD